MNTAHTQEQKITFIERLSHFLSRHRTTFLVVLIVLAVAAVALFVTLEVRNNRIERSLAEVEALQEEFARWAVLDEQEQVASIDSIGVLAQEILDSYSRLYAAQRALFIHASALGELERWNESAARYVELADRFPQSYLAPIALSQASVAYENGASADQALTALTQLVDNYDGESADVPRALFAIGRINESMGDIAEAARSYNRLIDDYPASSWTNLARDRIITLSVEGRIGS